MQIAYISAVCFKQGTTVENICTELKYLPGTRMLAKERSLLVLCDLSYSNENAIEVAIVSTPVLDVHHQKTGGGGERMYKSHKT